jgi:hypothetical protein
VTLNIPSAARETVSVRLSAPALWQEGPVTTRLVDSVVREFMLDGVGAGSILLQPQASLTGPNGAALWWEWKLPGQEEWVRTLVPDAGVVDFEDLALETIQW